MTFTTNVLNIGYGLTVVLFLLDCLPGFDIKSQDLKSFVYIGLLIGTPFTLIWNFYFIRTKTKRVIGIAFPTILLIMIFVIGPVRILFSTGSWKTQTILYQNGHLGFNTIEFQMQDIGALGYNKRTVEVFYLTPFFMTIQDVPAEIEKRVEWVKVDKDVNEHGLKSP